MVRALLFLALLPSACSSPLSLSLPELSRITGPSLRLLHPSSPRPALMSQAQPVHHKPFRKLAVRLIPHVAAALLACFEVVEDVREIGHGHGICFLLVSKFSREAFVLREQALEITEETAETVSSDGNISRSIMKLFGVVWRALTSRIAATVLAIAAVFAASVEVVEDVAPGGHHGAVLLALNELLEIGESISANVLKRSWLQEVFENRILRIAILLGAACLAALETFSSVAGKRIGAHYGVAVLSLLKVAGLLYTTAYAKKSHAD